MKNQKLITAISAAIFALGFNFMITEKWFPQISNFSLTHSFSDADDSRTKKNTIQVALLLDTSGSMDGLLEQAKSQLWQILNLLAETERQDGETKLEIALYEYGNTSRRTLNRQIRQLSGFTTDMDLISEKLFALTTNGGEEYCGEVILTSIKQLEWGQDDSNMKMIYIAGNERFTQGPISYSMACQLAKEQNITVNTIFCGDSYEGIKGMWKDGAQRTNGEYMFINHNEPTTYIETPYDDKINDLNKKLNETYIPYGKKGKAKKRNQTRQDANASGYSKSNSADRAAFKSSKKYKADSWDLVDAYKKDKSILSKAEVLPDSIQTLSIEDLEAKIESVSAERSIIQNEIQTLNQNRKAFIQKNSKVEAEKNNLNNSIRKSVENQAKLKGYKIKE